MKNQKLFLRAIVGLSAAGSLVGTSNSWASIVPQVSILTPSTQNFSLSNGGTDSPSTIQYNGSQGQNNNFAVGTSTSFGVSASSSSTPDYSVASKATLASDTGTSFNNQIGSSGAKSTASSYATSASESAKQATDYQASQKFAEAYAVGGTVKSQYDGATDKVAFKAGWEATWKNSAEGKQAYSSSFQSAFSSISQGSSSSTDASGTISGQFASVQSGSGSNTNATAGASKLYVQEVASGSTSYREAVAADYKAKLGGTLSANSTFVASGTTAGSYSNATAEQISTAATASLVSAASSTTTNSVTVKGIGADATFNSASNTKFDSDIKTNIGVAASTSSNGLAIAQGSDGKISSSATANGSANGNFGTNSTASSNSATYSSVFYQAF